VLLFDGELRPAGHVRLPAPAERLLFAPDGASLFAGISPTAGATVLARFGRGQGVALVSGRALFGAVRRIALAADGQTLLVALGSQIGLGIASTGTLAVERPLAGCDANDLVLTETGERVYVLCDEDHIAEVDPALRLVVRKALLSADSIPCRPRAGALSVNGTVLFVACAASGRLLYLDRVTLKPFDSVAVAPGTARLVLTPDGRRALLANPDAGALAVIDVRARTARRFVAIPGATDIAVAADGRAFVLGARRLVEVDAYEGRVYREIEVDEGARAVAAWPGPAEARMSWGYGAPDPGVSASASASRAGTL
jgi:DNA-binding beta-propeller fold protein YncE